MTQSHERDYAAARRGVAWRREQAVARADGMFTDESRGAQMGFLHAETLIQNGTAGATALRIRLQAESCPFLSLKSLDPGSGQKIPAPWHGAGAYPGGFIPET